MLEAHYSSLGHMLMSRGDLVQRTDFRNQTRKSLRKKYWKIEPTSAIRDTITDLMCICTRKSYSYTHACGSSISYLYNQHPQEPEKLTTLTPALVPLPLLYLLPSLVPVLLSVKLPTTDIDEDDCGRPHRCRRPGGKQEFRGDDRGAMAYTFCFISCGICHSVISQRYLSPRSPKSRRGAS